MRRVVYNGAQFCSNSDCCPVVTVDEDNTTVVIHDPSKPENGQFTMTVDEYNTLLTHAKRIE